MSMYEFAATLVAVAAMLALATAIWLLNSLTNRRLAEQRTRANDLQRQLELVRQSISGLTAGAVGVDRRLKSLDTRERLLSERQETYEIQQVDEQPYGQAIRLVQQGASVGRLVSELALSEGEAELIVRLHGQRDTA